MKMNKTLISTMLAITAFGFTASANAQNADAEASCPGCHGVVINGIQAVGSGGGKACGQRSEASWISTIDRMNGKNCGAQNVAGIAKYLAGIGLTPPPTVAPTTTTTTTTRAPTTVAPTTVAPTTTTTTAAPGVTTTNTAGPMTTTTTTTTVAATTTTTMSSGCNTYVNGTTQYKYSGSGSCHGHSDDGTGIHNVRDQNWCKKHMTHFNSSGNHTHAYPHPLCM